MRLVVALGGNALLRRGEPAEAELQRGRVVEAARALATLAERHELVVTHGNGPQVGLLALEAAAYPEVAPYPLDVLGAESQGMIGYLLAQALGGRVRRPVTAMLTQVVVDPADPAFAVPTKPIGPVYGEREAARLAKLHGWSLARDGDGVRRVVASPQPLELVELEGIRRLVDAGCVVICAGGGGIPVVRRGEALRGVEAVIDKDLTAALLAERLGADRLVLATDVEYVQDGWGGPEARPIRHTTPAALRRRHFAAGSMAPKIDAVCRFVERTGHGAAIGSLGRLEPLAAGSAGTQVRPGGRGVSGRSIGVRTDGRLAGRV